MHSHADRNLAWWSSPVLVSGSGMLVELAVSDLGVIGELSLVLGPGMTALTGETGAGKTLVVTAIELLVGGRADAGMVRPGADEARVGGRFVDRAGREVVLERVVPAQGRSRAYVDGRLAPVSALTDVGARLVDLHGQRTHESLLVPATQRAALDRFGGVDLEGLVRARSQLADVESALRAVGGDAEGRAQLTDLLRFELAELDRAGLDDPGEEAALEAEEELLADASAHREAAVGAHAALTGDGQAVDAVGQALSSLVGRAPFGELEGRLRGLAAELAEAAGDLRRAGEGIEEDPARLEVVRARRQLLRQLRRRYQAATLADLIAVQRRSEARLEELDDLDRRAVELERIRDEARRQVAVAAARVAGARRGAAPRLASAVEAHLRPLALPRAVVDIDVGGADPADDVCFLLAANPGEPALALSKVASGGELSRAMLALRLALGGAEAETLVFDEVDAGIGGEAALAVGRSLSALAGGAQVLVVTHLPQVAAYADAQVAVSKADQGGRTVASARLLHGDERVVEVSRMLSGHPQSDAAHGHAVELLSVAADHRRSRATAGAADGGR